MSGKIFTLRLAALAPGLILAGHGVCQVNPIAPMPPPAKPAPGTVLATVNGVPIKASDIEGLLWQWSEEQIAEDYINYLTVKSAADKAGIKLTDADVKERVKELIPRVKAQLAGKNVPDSRIYFLARSSLYLERLAAMDIVPAQWVKVSRIQFPYSGPTETAAADARKRADAAFASLQSGDGWDKVLASTGQPATNHGLLGWCPLSAFPAPAKDAVVATATGKFTKPVEIVNSLQIFRVEMLGKDAKGADLKELKEVYAQSRAAQLMAKLRAETKVTRNFTH